MTRSPSRQPPLWWVRLVFAVIAFPASGFYLTAISYVHGFPGHAGCLGMLAGLWWLTFRPPRSFTLSGMLVALTCVCICCALIAMDMSRRADRVRELAKEIRQRNFQRIGISVEQWREWYWGRDNPTPAEEDPLGQDCAAAEAGNEEAATRLIPILRERGPGWGRAVAAVGRFLNLHEHDYARTENPAFVIFGTDFQGNVEWDGLRFQKQLMGWELTAEREANYLRPIVLAEWDKSH